MSTRPSTRPLTAALSTLPDFPPASDYQRNKVTHRYSRMVLVDSGWWSPDAEPFRDTLEAFSAQHGALHDVTITKLAPGGYIVPHTDASRWRERWHIPIQEAGYTLLADIPELGEAGVPFRMEHRLPHSVVNDSDRDRIHLVIDLDRYVGPDEARPFVIL